MLNNQDGMTLVQALTSPQRTVSPECLNELRSRKLLIAQMTLKCRKAIAAGVVSGILFCGVGSVSASVTSQGRINGYKMFLISFLGLGTAGGVAEAVLKQSTNKEISKVNYLLDNLEQNDDV